MSNSELNKWKLPGWRIEQRYAPGVLIGNWREDTFRVQRRDLHHNSTHRTDFMNWGKHRPDIIVRRKAQLGNEGIPAKHLFHHHGNLYSNNMITWYDEDYNKRERTGSNKLPALRDWNGHYLAWRPEKTDHPLKGDPTNFGLYKEMTMAWADQIAAEKNGNYNTTYKTDYTEIPSQYAVKVRYATPKESSISVHTPNGTVKNLSLRGNSLPQSPEILQDSTKPPGESVAPPPVATTAGTEDVLVSC